MTTRTAISISEILKLVDRQEKLLTEARTRMQTDYDWYRLKWTDDRVEAKASGYQTYISNEPRTYAKRIISWLSGADLVVRIPLANLQAQARESATLKEQFIIGALRRADERLLSLVMPPLRDQLAFHIAIRGRYAGRALLVKKEDGSTMVDISPFDPLHTFYGVGADGVKWCVHRSIRTRDELESEYGMRAAELSPQSATGQVVYDYYDASQNGVFSGLEWLKELIPHHAARTPVFIGVVGATPPVLARDASDNQDTLEDFGESVYDENRAVYEQFNKIMSDMTTLVRRSVKPPIEVKSRDGKKVLQDDPYQEGSVVSVAEGESVKALDLLRMSLDTGPLLAMASGEMQRGSLPHSVYGDLQFQLSGFAINTLRQGVDASVHPRILAMENAYQQIARLICEQYAQGGYEPLTLSGRGMDRAFFQRQFPPDMIDPAGHVEITLAPTLPQDEMQRFSMAQIAREGKTPLLSDRTIRDSILRIQDVDSEEAIIKEQIAEVASPVALLYSFIQSAAQRGRPDLVAIYAEELKLLLQQRALATAGLGAPPPGGPNGSAPGPGGGPNPLSPNPANMPPAMLGVPPPLPTPQAGPNVPPGSPRPGAQQGMRS